ncbi:hypothetical protein BD413DRAFT_481874 [Trametes elegans]|nr:hypothetical protein BD413DRAFT_481874 [Trametes elegans]
MYVRTPSTGSSYSSGGSGVSDAPSTPSRAPRSIRNESLPPTPRTPNTPLTPFSYGSPGSYAPFPSPPAGSKHNMSYGLVTPPASPDKIARGQSDFHVLLDASARPPSFDIRAGTMLHPQTANVPAINHRVSRMLVNVGGFFAFEVVAQTGPVPTLSELVGQLVRAVRVPADPRTPAFTRGHALGNRVVFAGLSLRSIDRGVAVCDLHLRNMA